MLGGTLGEEVSGYRRTAQKEAVPAMSKWGDDALMALDANVNLMHTLGQADIKRKPDGLGSVVDENSADRHATLLALRYIANVYGTTGLVKLGNRRLLPPILPQGGRH
jgi:hypothetical protein